jgi:hypothetical protein
MGQQYMIIKDNTLEVTTVLLLLPSCWSLLQAWSNYISDTDYLPTLDAFGGKAETSFFAALIRYHWLLRCEWCQQHRNIGCQLTPKLKRGPF